MSKELDEQTTLEALIEEVKELLKEVKNEQTRAKQEMERHHKVTMRKLDKLREFEEIADMTNIVFEKRFSNIEQALVKILSK
ncbi:MAG: hypothetical protein HFJ32_02375 [Clostridia bacterium]|nr:hypothetical protein [Clostridia bacterium]